MITVQKTTLGDMNHGKCSTRNNSRFTGRTVVWELVMDGEGMEIGFKTKSEAEAIATFANLIGWKGTGDIVLKYEQHLRNASKAASEKADRAWDNFERRILR